MSALLTAEEEIALGRLAQAGLRAAARLAHATTSRLGKATRAHLAAAVARGQEARDRLVLANTGLILATAKYLCPGAVLSRHRDDVLQAGEIGLIAAAAGFDPDLYPGIRFSTYASHHVRLHLHKLMADIAMIHTPKPRRCTTERELRGVVKLRNRLRMTAQLRVARSGCVSIEAANIDIEDRPHDDGPVDPESRLADLLPSLTSTERQVVASRYGLDGATIRTLREIGTSLDLSRQRVSQIEHEALDKLRRRAAELDRVAWPKDSNPFSKGA